MIRCDCPGLSLVTPAVSSARATFTLVSTSCAVRSTRSNCKVLAADESTRALQPVPPTHLPTSSVLFSQIYSHPTPNYRIVFWSPSPHPVVAHIQLLPAYAQDQRGLGHSHFHLGRLVACCSNSKSGPQSTPSEKPASFSSLCVFDASFSERSCFYFRTDLSPLHFPI